ncbi:hypothetical protein [Sphingomonas nostoxanthinifaciens]|uniref:hypothetical protein n=1 Tax=Sphingomonas nostoxanthinifaciens TaxID=2872652 RepID=UPI001CC1EBA3|nr:hypothetical protein [Sphingomonas nostoxanthinifaciens]UAK25409.1 hypothetical protein K8P63_04310 [Sphingomonas nostoxanthinifaciens]
MRRLTGQSLWVVLLAIVAVIAAVLVFFYEQRHAMPTCAPPNVPIRAMDERLTGIGCATIGPYRAYHGVWVDAAEASWFYPGATDVPPGQLGKTDGWIFIDPADRAKIYAALPPIGEHERVRDQLVAVAFTGTEYHVDEPNKYGLHRFFDLGEIKDVRLVRRDFVSGRVKAP